VGILPYSPESELARTPWLTLLVIALCLFIYTRQDASSVALTENVDAFCAEPTPVMFRMAVKRITGGTDPDHCAGLLLHMQTAPDPAARLQELLSDTPRLVGLPREESDAVLGAAVERQFRRFVAQAPANLTAELWYQPSSWNPWRMISSTFAHADWEHVLGNVVFFFAFAAAVELIVGPAAFFGLIIGSTIFIGVADSLMGASLGRDIPTLGLSGVVTTMIALLAFLLPRGRIRCVFLWMPFFKRLPVPVWLAAAWFVGSDVWDFFALVDTGGVNVLAHVMGGAFGYLAGVMFFRPVDDMEFAAELPALR
jgi:membrane associated rhomboid family serine protease